MNCKDFESMVYEIVSGRGTDKTGQLEALEHAGRCLWCALRLDDETKLTENLQALAKAHHAQRAPARVEEALLQAFRERTKRANAPVFGLARTLVWRRLSWGLIFAAIVATTLVIVVGNRKPDASLLRHRQPDSKAQAASYGLAERAALDEWANEGPTDFIPLGTCDDPECLDDAVVVRVALPAEVLLDFGLPVSNDWVAGASVNAEVVIGSEGVPSAIRFVE